MVWVLVANIYLSLFKANQFGWICLWWLHAFWVNKGPALRFTRAENTLKHENCLCHTIRHINCVHWTYTHLSILLHENMLYILCIANAFHSKIIFQRQWFHSIAFCAIFLVCWFFYPFLLHSSVEFFPKKFYPISQTRLWLNFAVSIFNKNVVNFRLFDRSIDRWRWKFNELLFAKSAEPFLYGKP